MYNQFKSMMKDTNMENYIKSMMSNESVNIMPYVSDNKKEEVALNNITKLINIKNNYIKDLSNKITEKNSIHSELSKNKTKNEQKIKQNLIEIKELLFKKQESIELKNEYIEKQNKLIKNLKKSK